MSYSYLYLKNKYIHHNLVKIKLEGILQTFHIEDFVIIFTFKVLCDSIGLLDQLLLILTHNGK